MYDKKFQAVLIKIPLYWSNRFPVLIFALTIFLHLALFLLFSLLKFQLFFINQLWSSQGFAEASSFSYKWFFNSSPKFENSVFLLDIVSAFLWLNNYFIDNTCNDMDPCGMRARTNTFFPRTFTAKVFDRKSEGKPKLARREIIFTKCSLCALKS